MQLLSGFVGGILAGIRGENFWWGNTVRTSPVAAIRDFLHKTDYLTKNNTNSKGYLWKQRVVGSESKVEVTVYAKKQWAYWDDFIAPERETWNIGYGPEDVAHNFQYADRVRMRGLEDPVSHNFPYSFDDSILATEPILKNNGYRMFQLEGTMNDKFGVFEIGLTKDNIINHRFFRPHY